MADILTGSTNHKSHAPLSTQHTLAMCRHLEELNNDALKQIQDLKNGLAHTESELGNIRSDVNQSKSAIARVDQRVDNTAARLEATRIEVAGNRGTCKEMGITIRQNAKGLSRLHDEQKTINGSMLKMKEEATHRDDEIGKLRLDHEKLKGRMNDELEDKIHQLDNWVQELLQENGATKKTLINQKESLQIMGCDLKATQEDFSKLSTDLKRFVKHLNEMGNRLDGPESNLSRANANFQKLQIDHDAIKTNTQSLQVDFQGLATKLQKLNDDHMKCFRNVGLVREGMEKVSAHHEETREILNRTVSDVKELQDGHINSNATMLTLHKNLERVHGIASSVQRDLKLTNALVLPNLSPDSGAGNTSRTRTPTPTGHHLAPHHLNRI